MQVNASMNKKCQLISFKYLLYFFFFGVIWALMLLDDYVTFQCW